MTVIALEKDRRVGKEWVEVFFVGQSLGAEHGVVPTTAENPCLAVVLSGVGAKALLNFGDVFRTFEVGLLQAKAAFDEMDVGIGEGGQHEPTASVDGFGGVAAERGQLLISPNGDDFALANGNALRPRLLRVDGVDFGVKDEDLRRRYAGILLGAGSKDTEKQKRGK